MPPFEDFSSEDLAEEIWAMTEREEPSMVKAFLAAMASLLGISAVYRLTQQIDDGEIIGMSEAVNDILTNVSVDEKAFSSAQQSVMQQAGQLTADAVSIGPAYDGVSPRAVAASGNITSYLVRHVSESVQERLRQIISDQVEGIVTRDEARRRIRQQVGLLPQHAVAVQNLEASLLSSGVSVTQAQAQAAAYANRLLRYRAEMISRTEVARAASVGQQEYWEQLADDNFLPPNTLRKWIVTPDERLCEICGPMEDLLIPLDGFWSLNNGDQVYYPTDSHPNCRCSMGLVFPDQFGKADPLGLQRWLAMRPTIVKHAEHDQKTHGKWAKGRAKEYQGQHAPPDDAAPLHDLLAEGTWFPDDVYTHPQFYVHGDDDVVAESLAAIREARGNPDALITVYRSVPPGVTSINTGDWVSLSRVYAENHGAERDREYWDADREWKIDGPTPETSVSGVGQWVSYDEPRDWPVVEAKVPARLILNGGNDLIEWGYWGPDVEDGEAISKHAEHDQQSHGNWATGEQASEVHQLKNRMVLLALLERGRRYSDLERIRPYQEEQRLQGGALIEELTGAKREEVSLVADGIMGVAENVGLAFFREQSYDLIREEIVKVDALLGELSRATDTVDAEPDLVKEITNKVIPSLKSVREQLQSHLVGSQLLAENVDLDLLTTPPPDGKMTSWADSVADNPDGGAGFLEGVRLLAATPIGYKRSGPYKGGPQEANALMAVAGGELLSAHIRKATSEVSEVRLDSRISELDFTKPFADQQERPLSDLEFSDPLLDLLPPSTLTKIGNIMDVVWAGVSSAPIRDIDRGSWKRDLDDPLRNIAQAFKHSVNGRIAERIYAASGDRTIVGIGLVDVYARVNSQTEAWAKSPVIEYSAQLQQSVSRMVGREDSFDSFAERQNLVGLLGTAFTDVYARAVYAETQALLALSPETSLKAARGTKLKLSPELDLPVKVVEKAIDDRRRPTESFRSKRSRLSDSMWEVGTDAIGRQPLSSWSTSTDVAHTFADLGINLDGPVPDVNGYAIVQRAVIPDSQIFSTALTGPGSLGEQEIIAIEGTRGTTNVSVLYTSASSDRALSNAQARDADGDGWIYEGTDREQFVGKADKKFEYDREVPEQSREGIVSLLTWIPDNWDAAYLIEEPVTKHAEHDQKTHGKWARSGGVPGGSVVDGYWVPGPPPLGFNEQGLKEWKRGLELFEERPELFRAKVLADDGLPVPEGEEPSYAPGAYDELSDFDDKSALMTIGRAINRAWEDEITRAIALNKIDPGNPEELLGNALVDNRSEAFERYGYDAKPERGTWKELPDQLFHVTTNLGALQESGFKTREQLADEAGSKPAGLGGGVSDAISFTTDPPIVDAIVRGIHEMREVVRDDTGPAAVERMKAEVASWDTADERDGRTGLSGAQQLLAENPSSMEERGDFYKDYSYWRQFNVPNRPDPLFFSPNYQAFVDIDPAQIGVVTISPSVAGAKGWQVEGMGEWRTIPEAVEVVAAEARDADGDGIIFEGTDQERFVGKHANHDQKSHGNWATGRATPKRFDRFTEGGGQRPGKRLYKIDGVWHEDDVHIRFDDPTGGSRSLIDSYLTQADAEGIFYEEIRRYGEVLYDDFEQATQIIVDALNDVSPEFRPQAIRIRGDVDGSGRSDLGDPPVRGAMYDPSTDEIVFHPAALGLTRDTLLYAASQWGEVVSPGLNPASLRKLMIHELAHSIDWKIHQRTRVSGDSSWRKQRDQLASDWFEASEDLLDPEGPTTWYLHLNFTEADRYEGANAPAELFAEWFANGFVSTPIPNSQMVDEVVNNLDLTNVLVPRDGDGDGLVFDGTGRERSA